MGEVVQFSKRQEAPKLKIDDYVSFVDKDATGARRVYGNVVSIEGGFASVEVNVGGGMADSKLVQVAMADLQKERRLNDFQRSSRLESNQH